MYFQQFIVDGMGCMSYLIGCPVARVACVVDPKRDVQDYIDKARANGMEITHIFETHVHADHVSGNMELKSRTGAQICMHKNSPVTFDFTPVSKGDTFDLGNARLEIATELGTPMSSNLALLGFFSAFEKDLVTHKELRNAIDQVTPSRFKKINFKVFDAGFEMGTQ